MVQEGQTYILSATHPNYPTTDKKLDITRKTMSVFVSPTNPERGEYVSIIVQDSSTAEPLNSTIITVDEVKSPASFRADVIGQHILKVARDGYETTTIYFNITEPIEVFGPEEIKKNSNTTLRLSRAADWKINMVGADKQQAVVAYGSGDVVNFVPKKAGDYQVLVNDELRKSYTLKGGIGLPEIGGGWWIIGIILIIVIVALISIARRSSGGRKMKYAGIDSEKVVRRLR